MTRIVDEKMNMLGKIGETIVLVEVDEIDEDLVFAEA